MDKNNRDKKEKKEKRNKPPIPDRPANLPVPPVADRPPLAPPPLATPPPLAQPPLAQPPLAPPRDDREQRLEQGKEPPRVAENVHKSILVGAKGRAEGKKSEKRLQFSEVNPVAVDINSVDSYYEAGPQDPLPTPPVAKPNGRVGKASVDFDDPDEDVNPTVPQDRPLPPPPLSGPVRAPFQRRVEPIVDEDQKRKFEELRAAVLSVSTYAGHVCENIDKFFKYNKNNIVRPMIHPEEMEQKKARTWVFFLLLLQFCVCAAFLGFVVWCGVTGKPYAGYFFAGSLGFYFFIRLFSVLIFVLRRGTKNFRCLAKKYDPNNAEYEEVFICIPAYNEGKEAFMNTIGSISASNYPKHKMYMFFIVDGNKANSYENLMECLTKKPYAETVPAKHRILKHGVYDGIPYSVFLKEENRGKRDSQWLFVELLRNMIPEFAPTYVFFVDSDTAFHPDSLRFMVEDFKGDEKIAGVCGKLTLSNFKFFSRRCSNTFYFMSTMFIVGYQFYEYHYNQLIGKQSEAAFDAVSCLPGAFSVFRANVLTGVEARIGERLDEELSSTVIAKMGPFSRYYYEVKQTLPLVLDDFFSKPTVGIVDRNLYELGEDRTLTIRFLEKGLKCLYEPRAVAYTECPDGIVKYFQQRRRWNNSTFVNLACIMLKGRLWCKLRTFPIMIFSFFDLFGSYILPANAILLMYVIWQPMFDWIADKTCGNGSFNVCVNINATYVIAAILIVQALVVMISSINTADMFYVFITFIQGLLMLASFPFFVLFCITLVNNFIGDMSGSWAPAFIMVLFPLLHTISSISLPPAFFTVIYYWAMIPTAALTLPLYSFVHLDDFSWGNR
eukprot:TRINITY_DN223_c0_g1_i1.p1 TRINITY_DN223_c0_g1~~TRINITY_DN223_c0_g1_i1.p1  ORF type:complete len:836 (+),score=267.36 TRINITY_DN223_c0_g1_i1:237-2744(+)